MGNKLGRRRQVVDDRYTKPQGLYQHKDVDQKRLRKLILDSKLAPCYPGDDESTMDLEECPICFLYYPSLNRSRCCLKGICTECFLQMKSPNSARPTQCPFCKTSDYAVEFRGVKSKEEKGIEQMEEQRIIEAKIRIRKQEIQEEEERMQKRKETTSTRQTNVQGDFELNSAPSQESAGQPQQQTHDGDDEFDLDLDNLMVNEAIWLSLQESGRQRNGIYQDPSGEGHAPGDLLTQLHESPSSPSRGLAHAIASMAEHQQMTVDSSTPHGRYWVGEVAENCPLPQNYNSPLLQGAECWGAAGLGGGDGYVSAALDAMDDGEGSPLPPPPPPLPLSMPVSMDVNGVGFQSLTGGVMVPESYEEQVLLAMAVSRADGRARTSHMAVGYGNEFIE